MARVRINSYIQAELNFLERKKQKLLGNQLSWLQQKWSFTLSNSQTWLPILNRLGFPHYICINPTSRTKYAWPSPVLYYWNAVNQDTASINRTIGSNKCLSIPDKIVCARHARAVCKRKPCKIFNVRICVGFETTNSCPGQEQFWRWFEGFGGYNPEGLVRVSGEVNNWVAECCMLNRDVNFIYLLLLRKTGCSESKGEIVYH